jgi:hypothetical protein
MSALPYSSKVDGHLEEIAKALSAREMQCKITGQKEEGGGAGDRKVIYGIT